DPLPWGRPRDGRPHASPTTAGCQRRSRGGDRIRTRARPPPRHEVREPPSGARARSGPSEADAEPAVDQAAPRLVVDPEADDAADLEVRREEVVQAGVDELLREVVLLGLGHDPEILDVREPASVAAERDFQDRRRGPERIAVAALAVG